MNFVLYFSDILEKFHLVSCCKKHLKSLNIFSKISQKITQKEHKQMHSQTKLKLKKLKEARYVQCLQISSTNYFLFQFLCLFIIRYLLSFTFDADVVPCIHSASVSWEKFKRKSMKEINLTVFKRKSKYIGELHFV